MGSTEELRQKYVELSRKMAAKGPHNPNIDGMEAESVNPDKAMRAYHDHYCRRCYKYDCFLHKIQVRWTLLLIEG